ncbi:MAG: (d)CMP kinase [Candidatus Eisenbacteria bacterium]
MPTGQTSNPILSSRTRVTRLIIAVDGPAASGKSTTAKLVADRLGFTYIDSGAMYRAAALKAVRLSVSMDDNDRLGEVAREASIELTGRGRGPILLDGEDVTDAIRDDDVSVAASLMSTVPEVRRALVAQQREIGHRESCVMEGRDIGTVVFPDADLKVFLVASIEERARRRFEQSATQREAAEAGGERDDAEQVLREIMENIAERDRRDSTRADSPLRKAEDAVEVDTTSMTIEQQVDSVVDLAVARGAVPPGEREVRRL